MGVYSYTRIHDMNLHTYTICVCGCVHPHLGTPRDIVVYMTMCGDDSSSELVLQCVAVCCSLLQRLAACCSDVEKETPSPLRIKSTFFIFPLQNSFSSVLQCVAVCAAFCSTLQ